jgi:hypothetical protein
LPEEKEERKLKKQNRKKIMKVHNENKRRKEVPKRKERHNKNLRNEAVTEEWQYSRTAGKGEQGRSTRLS